MPNAGHDLREMDANGKRELFPVRAVNTLAAFCHCQIFDKVMPKLVGKYTGAKDGVALSVAFEGTLKSQRVWVADSDSRDFRKARWREEVVSSGDPGVKVIVKGPVTLDLKVPAPASGFRAVYVETEFEVGGIRFPLSTQLRILEAKK